jgi:hypothetical protein
VIQGNLDRLHLGDLLQWLQLGRLNGRLTLLGRQSKRHLDFLDGNIVYVSSSVPQERLASWLANEGLLPVEQLRRLLGLSLLRRTLFTNLLIDRGGFSVDGLRGSLTRLAETITSRVLAAGQIRFVFDSEYPVAQLLGMTLKVEPNTLVLEAARRTDENGHDAPPEEFFPTEFSGEAFDSFFWDLIRNGISDGDRVDGEEIVEIQTAIRNILTVLADWLTSSPGLVPLPTSQASRVTKRLGTQEPADLEGLPHAVWNQMVLACCIRSPHLQPPETLPELAQFAAELDLWQEMFDNETWLRPSARRIDELVENAAVSWSAAATAAAPHCGVSPGAARLAAHLVTVPTDLVLWVLSTLPVSHPHLQRTLVRELPRRLGRSLAYMADFPPAIRQLFEGSLVTHLGACLHLGRDALPTSHVWPTTVPGDSDLLATMLPDGSLAEAAAAVRETIAKREPRPAAS